MSTKVYSGFKINTTDLNELLQMVKSFKPWVEQEALKVPVFYLRHTQDAGKSLSDRLLDWEHNKFKLEQEGYTGLAQYDTKFSILFIPCGEFTLGYTFTAHKDWHNEWLKQEGVLEYNFWDNTDAPDDISEEDWLQREKDWSVLTGEPMSMQGFIIEATSPWVPGISQVMDLYRKMYGDK